MTRPANVTIIYGRTTNIEAEYGPVYTLDTYAVLWMDESTGVMSDATGDTRFRNARDEVARLVRWFEDQDLVVAIIRL